MKERSRALSLLLFCLRFVLIATICFGLWWWKLLPYYAWLLGQASGSLINLFVERPIEAFNVATNPEGILTSDTSLVFTVAGYDQHFHVSSLVNSVVTYVSLVLATLRLSWLRRIVILVGGLAFFFGGQVTYVVLVYVFAEEAMKWREVSMGIGQFWLTLPFAMWILLAYWQEVTAMFQGTSKPGQETEPDQPADAPETSRD